MPDPDPWRCPICGRRYPVPSMTRDCLDKHDAETAPDQETT